MGFNSRNCKTTLYTESDVEKARYLQNKFDNVDTIAQDSCFHLGYMGKAEERDENDKPIIEVEKEYHTTLILKLMVEYMVKIMAEVTTILVMLIFVMN